MSLNDTVMRLGEEIAKLSQRFERLKQENRELRDKNYQLENNLKQMEGGDNDRLSDYLNQLKNINQEEQKGEIRGEKEQSDNNFKDEKLL